MLYQIMGYILKIISLFVIIHITTAGLIKKKISYEDLTFPELKYVNKNVNPCDNFYEFACGNFEKYNPRPDNQLLWDNFKILQEEISKISIDILKAPTRKYDPKSVRKAKDMFFACANPEKNAEQTLKPLYDVFSDLGGWPLIANIPKGSTKFSWDIIGNITANYGIPFFISWGIRPYFLDTTINMLTITRDPLKLPATAMTDIEDLSTDFHSVQDDTMSLKEEIVTPPYKQYLVDVSLKFIQSDIRDLYKETIVRGIEEVYDLFLKIQFSNQITFDEKYSNGVINTIEDLQNWSDEFSANYKTRINWLSFFNNAFSKTGAKITKDTQVHVMDQVALTNILTIVETTPTEVLMNFVFARLITYMSPDASIEMWNEINELYKQLNYTVFSRDEYCMRKITNYPNIGLSLAVAHEYQNYYFDVRKIYDPEEIIQDMLRAFFELLDEKDWVDEAAKKWVQEKANGMLHLIGFPDFVYDPKKLDEYYSTLRVCMHDHFGNSQNMRVFNFAQNIKIIDKAPNRNDWNQSPLYVNAYYNQLGNKITFPAGIMNKPFFTGKSKLVDYSRIGALVGHEITHGFDTQGRNTDLNGNLVANVWNETVINAFNNRSDCFINQYSQYYIDEINKNVNGGKTNIENIADNGGLREAFRAFQKLNIPKDNISGEFTPEQLFFISYGTMWCKIDTPEALVKMQNDTHAPNRFRVIGTLSNMKEFSETFNCPAGSKMNPENKCVLW